MGGADPGMWLSGRSVEAEASGTRPERPPGGDVRAQARNRGVEPVTSLDDMVREGAFGTDEELAAFLAHVHSERLATLA